MFPFTSCVSILRRRERPTDWKQINGTLTFLVCTPNNNHSNSDGNGRAIGDSSSNNHISGEDANRRLATVEEERRGAISFERTDRNAIYIRMLGDVKMRGSPEKLDTGQATALSEGDRKMIEQVSQPEHRPRLRSRFLSMSKSRRPHRRSASKLSPQGRLLVDDFYSQPAQLLLQDIGLWDFNIFTFDTLSGGRSVFHIAYHLFQTYDLIRSFRLDTVCLLHFLSLVEANYHESNPYHNAVHAADVTQAMHCFLQEKEIYNATTDLEKMVALVAALTHDLDHPGVNNAFLIVTANHLATLYENISVLENHHFRCAMGLLQESGLINHLGDHERSQFYRQLKELILATDITRQPEFLLKFCRCIENGDLEYRTNEEHRLIMLQIALKCADISNPCRPWRVSQRWSRRVCNEFFLQGDTERSLQIPVTPLCDRIGNTVAKIQNGFMQFVAHPLFKAWHQFMQTPLTSSMLAHISSNQENWKVIMGGVHARKKHRRSMDAGDGDDNDNDSCDSDVDYEFLEEEVKVAEELGPVGEERMDVVDADRKEGKKEEEEEEEPMEVKSTIPDEVPVVKTVTLVLPSEVEEGETEGPKGEEAGVLHNDLGTLYHYQAEPEESGGLGPVASAPRCLSPVSEGGEMGSSEITSDLHPLHTANLNNSSNGRRYSVPAIVSVRKDLSFYLGLRRDSAGPSPSSSTGSFASSTNSCSYSAFSRRQSLPTTAMYFHGSSQPPARVVPDLSSVSPRSLSVDALLARPKITSFSPGGLGEMIGGFPNAGNFYGDEDCARAPTPSQSEPVLAGSGARDSGALTPLFNQTLLLLQGGDMTRFTSNPTARRASYEPGLAEHTRQGTNCPRPQKDGDATGSGYNSGRRLTLPVAHAASPTASHLQREQNHQERRYRKQQQQQDKQSLQAPRVGLAASWPTLNTKRRTTNGASAPSHTTNTTDNKIRHEHNHVIDKTSASVMDTALSSSSYVSSAAMYADSTKTEGARKALFHGDADRVIGSSSASFQSVTTSEHGHIDVTQVDESSLNLPVPLTSQHPAGAGQRTNPLCLSHTSSTSSSAQEDNHPPRPQ